MLNDDRTIKVPHAMPNEKKTWLVASAQTPGDDKESHSGEMKNKIPLLEPSIVRARTSRAVKMTYGKVAVKYTTLPIDLTPLKTQKKANVHAMARHNTKCHWGYPQSLVHVAVPMPTTFSLKRNYQRYLLCIMSQATLLEKLFSCKFACNYFVDWYFLARCRIETEIDILSYQTVCRAYCFDTLTSTLEEDLITCIPFVIFLTQ